MNAAIYARVSTQRQAQTQTIEQQMDRLQNHCKNQGLEVLPENIFRDDGYSGAKLNRPGLDRLRDKAAQGEIGRVLITAPDRLGRNYVHQVIVIEELERLGCVVEFLDRPMSQDPHDQLLLQIRGAVAEYERTLIAERMRRGRQAKLQAGNLLPCTRLPYGYSAHPDRPRDPSGVSLNQDQATIVREIFAKYLETTTSLLMVAYHINELKILSPSGKSRWSSATVRVILTNPTYTGSVYAGRYQTTGLNQKRRSANHPVGKHADGQKRMPPEHWELVTQVPPIVSQDEFDRVQAKLSENKRMARRNNTKNDYLLRGLISCGYCKAACVGRRSRGGERYQYYVCRITSMGRKWQEGKQCPGRSLPTDQLDKIVWEDLCKVLLHPESIKTALDRAHGGQWVPQELQSRSDALRQAQASLKRQIDRLSEAYLHEVIRLDEYQRKRQDLELKMDGLEKQRTQLSASQDVRQHLADQITSASEFCARMAPVLESATFEQKRRLVELLVDQVVVTGDEIDIHYVIPLSSQSEAIRFCHLRKDYRTDFS
jgi:site-specific DNA recombinase